MPRKYNGRRGALRFFAATGLLQDYVYTNQFNESLQGGFSGPVGTVNGGANDNPGPAAGWSPAAPYGVRAVEVPLFPEYEAPATTDTTNGATAVAAGQASDVWLTDPQNLIWGVKREIQVFREFKPKKDTIEYTMYTRVGCNVENPQASVVVKNVKFAQ
jgi:hypothetical protein